MRGSGQSLSVCVDMNEAGMPSAHDNQLQRWKERSVKMNGVDPPTCPPM